MKHNLSDVNVARSYYGLARAARSYALACDAFYKPQTQLQLNALEIYYAITNALRNELLSKRIEGEAIQNTLEDIAELVEGADSRGARTLALALDELMLAVIDAHAEGGASFDGQVDDAHAAYVASLHGNEKAIEVDARTEAMLEEEMRALNLTVTYTKTGGADRRVRAESARGAQGNDWRNILTMRYLPRKKAFCCFLSEAGLPALPAPVERAKRKQDPCSARLLIRDAAGVEVLRQALRRVVESTRAAHPIH